MNKKGSHKITLRRLITAFEIFVMLFELSVTPFTHFASIYAKAMEEIASVESSAAVEAAPPQEESTQASDESTINPESAPQEDAGTPDQSAPDEAVAGAGADQAAQGATTPPASSEGATQQDAAAGGTTAPQGSAATGGTTAPEGQSSAATGGTTAPEGQSGAATGGTTAPEGQSGAATGGTKAPEGQSSAATGGTTAPEGKDSAATAGTTGPAAQDAASTGAASEASTVDEAAAEGSSAPKSKDEAATAGSSGEEDEEAASTSGSSGEEDEDAASAASSDDKDKEKEEREEPEIIEGEIYADDNYKISFDKEAEIPEGSELVVNEISSENYESYIESVYEAAGLAPDAVAGLKVLDISIVKDEEEIHPNAEVYVELNADALFGERALYSDDEVRVIHINGEDTEPLGCDIITGEEDDDNPATTQKADAIGFSTGSFSPFAIIQLAGGKSATVSGGGYEVTVNYDNTSGIPAGTEFVVSEVGDTEGYGQQSAALFDGAVYSLEAIRAFDIRFVDRESEDVYQPGKDISLSINLTDNGLIDGAEAHLISFGGEAWVMDAGFEGQTVSFGTSNLTTFGIAQFAVKKTLTAGDGRTYLVTVNYDSVSGIPEGAVLAVSEITNGYDEYAEKSSEELDEGTVEVVRAFDISLRNPDTGEEYQPTKPIQVSIDIFDENLEERSEDLDIVHIHGENEEQTEVVESSVNDGVVEFETESFSVYVVVRKVIEKTLTASDGNEYLVTVSFDSTAGIPENAVLSVNEITESDVAYDQYVTESTEKLEVLPHNVSFARAFDITLMDPETGDRYQPSKDVKVNIKLLTEEIGEDLNVGVVHFGAETEIMDAEVKEETVEFETSGFSVYVVIGSEGGEIETPRVEFHFIDYEFTYNSSTDTYQAGPYKFNNTGDDHAAAGEDPTNVQTSQILVSGEALENVPNPPNLITYDTDGTTVLNSKYFFGWYMVSDATVNSSTGKISYTWDTEPEQIFLEKGLTIKNIVWANSDHTAITSLVWSMNGIDHTATDVDEYGVVHVYLAPIYEDYYFVNFHLGAKETAKDSSDNWDRTGLWSNLMTRRLVVLGSDGTAEVHIGLSAPATDVKRQVFSGWETVTVNPRTETVDGASVTINYPVNRVNMYDTVDPATGIEKNSPGHTDGYYIIVGRDSSVATVCDEILGTNKSLDLYPVFAEARWIYFDIGKSGNGATYVGAKYLLTSDNEEGRYYLSQLPGKTAHTHDDGQGGTVVDDTAARRTGYVFAGWYYGAVRDANGNIANLTGSYTYTDEDTGLPVTVPQATKLTDDEGNLINVGELKNSNNETILKIEGGKLFVYKALDELTLYANWVEVEDTTIQVNVWRQKVTDSKNAAANAKTYDYVQEYSYNVSATSGKDLAWLRSNNKLRLNGSNSGTNVEELTEQGFTYVKTKMSTATVASDGTTVIDVYYDREMHALTFLGSGAGYQYSVTSGSDTPQYAFVNGEWLALTRGSVIETKTEYFLTQTSGGTIEYTGTVYDSNSNVVADPIYPNTYYRSTRARNQLYWNSRTIYTYEWRIPEYEYRYNVNNTNGEYGKVGDKYYVLTRNVGSYVYNRTGYTYTQTTSNNGTQYGIVNGAIQQIYYRNNAWRITNNTYASRYYGNRYTISNSSSAAYTGDRYILISGTAENNQSGFEQTQINMGTNLFGRDGNNNTYFQLLVTENDIFYTYVDDNGDTQTYSGDRYTRAYEQTGNLIAYNGVRYSRSNNNSYHTVYAIDALYGQNIGNQFPIPGYADGQRWTPGTNHQGWNQVMVIVDIMPDEDITFTVSTSTATEKTMNYYVQALTGQTPEHTYNNVGYILYNSVKANYNYITSEDFLDLTGFTKNGSYPTISGNTYLDNYNNTINFYYLRNTYSITFVTQYPSDADLWDGSSHTHTDADDSKTISNVPYQSELISYGTGGTNFWTPPVPPHYTFAGWYEDEAGTKAYKFNTTMPSGDVIVYGKWTPERFRIKIDPNGGVIDHVNHWGADDFELTAGFTGQYTNSSTCAYTFATFRPNSSATSDTQKYDTSASTFFKNNYNQTISEYGTLLRDYIEITETEANAMRTAYANATTAEERAANTVYYYLNTQMLYDDNNQERLDIPADLRNALYLAESEVEDYFTFFRNVSAAGGGTSYGAGDIEGWKKDFLAQDGSGNYLHYRHRNNKEFYTLVGWFQVYSDGTESSAPYNFEDVTKSNVTLKAEWRLDGGYIIQYTPEQTVNGKLINGDMDAWTDPVTAEGTYTDGAKTNIYRQPNNITEDGDAAAGANYDFIGWRLVSPKVGEGGTTIYVPLENGVYYQPGDEWIVRASYADANSIIHMQAVYQLKAESIRRPGVINLTLDANSGYLVDENGTELTDDANINWSIPGIAFMEAATDRIHFGDIQSNIAVHLYQYATTLDKDAQNNALDPVGVNYFKHPEGYLLIGFDKISNEGDFVADFEADSVISLARTDRQTLYAVWEPMVYITFKNETRDTARYINGGPVSFNLSSNSSTALTILNAKNGLYKREPVTSFPITLPVGESITLAVPYGKEKDITVSGVNNIGPGSILYVNSTIEQPYTSARRTGDPEEVFADNTQSFSLTDILVEHEKGLVVTFTSDLHDRTIVFDQNFGNNATTEKYFTNEALATNTGSVTMPYSNTNFGFELKGWALTRDATTPLYAVDYELKNEELTAFFGNEQVKTLYAVWQSKDDAVYVYKTVPTPGSKNEEFEFTVKMQGEFDYQDLSGTSVISLQGTFKLKDYEYAMVKTEQYLGHSIRDTGNAEKAYLKYTVTVYYYDTTTSEWKIDADRGDTQQATAQEADTGQFLNNKYAFSVEEGAVQYYTSALDVTSQFTKVTESKFSWTQPDAGGTARFTNTHETKDITVKKKVVPNYDETAFTFTASYKLKDDDVVSLGTFTLAGGQQKELKKIPTGAVLTIKETVNNNYTTTTVSENSVVDLDTTNDNIFKCSVLQDDAITYNNTLKSFPVKIQLRGYDGTTYTYTVNADFTLTRGSSSNIFTGRRVNTLNNIIYRTGTSFRPGDEADGKLYIGDYTLKETWIDPDYMALTPNFDIKITKDGVSLPGTHDGVELTTEGTGENTVYVITITNRKTVPVNIAKVLNDPLITTTLDFYFNVKYYLDGVGAAREQEVKVTSSDITQIKIPIKSKLVIEEQVNRQISGQAISQRYTTTHRIGTGAVEDGASVTINSLTETTKVTFTNTFKSSEITVKKVVEKDDDTNIFTFKATLKVGNNPVKQYTIFDNGTPDDDTDDLKTDNDGQVSFKLVKDGTKVLSIPIGAKLQLQETEAKKDDASANEVESYTTTVTASYTAGGDYTAYQTYDLAHKTFELTQIPEENLTITFKNGFGIEVYFKKVGGYGSEAIDGGGPLSGATFKLYDKYSDAADPEHATKAPVSITVNDATVQEVTSESTFDVDHECNVHFKVRSGVYYMAETNIVPGYEKNENVYRVVVGKAGSEVGGITLPAGTEFLIEQCASDTTVNAVPDIKTYGIMNTSEAKRKVILRKVDSGYNAEKNVQLQVLCYDRTPFKSKDINGNETDTFLSGESGVYFIDDLPYGKYFAYEEIGANKYWFRIDVKHDEVKIGTRQSTEPAP